MARAGKPLDPWQVESCELMMAVRDGRWACTDYAEWVARQNGKGALLEARVLAGFFLFGEQLIAWSAHEYKTAMEAFRRVKTLIKRLGRVVDRKGLLIEVQLGVDRWCLVKVNNTNGDEGLERLDTEQRIKFIARSKGSGRGFTAGVQIIDEAFAYTDLHQDALAPTTLAVENEQTIYMSTPPLNGMSAGPMYALRERADAGGDDSLGYRDWGLGGWLEDRVDADRADPEFVDVDDESHWPPTCPALAVGRITIRKLQILRRKLGKVGYAREVLGLWPRPVKIGGGVIGLELWESRQDPGSRPGDALVFAVDVSPGGRSAAIASGGRRDDGRLHGKVVDYRPGTAWVAARVAELKLRYRPRAILLYPAGPAGALLADLQEAGVDPALVVGREMAQACGALVNDLTDDRIRFCDQEPLNTAVGQATSRELADAWAWDLKGSGDICPLVAVTLAAHGFRVYGSQEEVEPWAEYA